MNEVDNIIKIAKGEVGYLEKSKSAYNKNPDVLYKKSSGAGSDNYTKYAKEMDTLKVYNGIKQGYPWCNVFVDWCFVKALGVKRTKELLYGFSAGCEQDWEWFKAKNRIFYSPQKGDLVIFGDCDHVGIVENVKNNRIYTIEGNTSNNDILVVNGGSVSCKNYGIDSRYIKGYLRPLYKNSNGNYIEKKKYSGTFPKLPSRGYFYYPNRIVDTGTQVEYLQRFLNWATGSQLDIDGYCGPLTHKAILLYQKTYKLEKDGCFGPACLAKAKTIEI